MNIIRLVILSLIFIYSTPLLAQSSNGAETPDTDINVWDNWRRPVEYVDFGLTSRGSTWDLKSIEVNGTSVALISEPKTDFDWFTFGIGAGMAAVEGVSGSGTLRIGGAEETGSGNGTTFPSTDGTGADVVGRLTNTFIISDDFATTTSRSLFGVEVGASLTLGLWQFEESGIKDELLEVTVQPEVNFVMASAGSGYLIRPYIGFYIDIELERTIKEDPDTPPTDEVKADFDAEDVLGIQAGCQAFYNDLIFHFKVRLIHETSFSFGIGMRI